MVTGIALKLCSICLAVRHISSWISYSRHRTLECSIWDRQSGCWTSESLANIHFRQIEKQGEVPMLAPAGCEILVVDDDAAIRDCLAMLLQSSGYEVSTAIHGFDALLQLRRKVPAIVISDLNMPQMSGFEFL